MKLKITILLFMLQSLWAIAYNPPKKGFYSTKPANDWMESIVTGNGTMGALVEGNPYREKIILNHAQLFLPINNMILPPSQGKHLEKVRNLLLEGKGREASQFVVDLANSEGFKVKHASDPFIPAFCIKIESDSLQTSEYHRSINFETGEANVEWCDENGQFVRRTFVSRPDNVVVIQLSATTGKINTTISLERVRTSEEVRRVKFRLNNQDNLDTELTGRHGLSLFFRAKFENPQLFQDFTGFEGYEGVLSLISCDGKITTTEQGLHIENASQALFLARIEMSESFSHDKTRDIEKNLEALPHDYVQLLMPHQKIQSELFNRVKINLKSSDNDKLLPSEELLAKGGLNKALIERLFDASRYNVISATGIHAPNLQGIWGGTMTPNWSSDFTTNGNLPVAVSHYLQANTPELMLPLFNMLETRMKDFRTNAKVLYNCRGIHIPSHFSMSGLDFQFDSTWPMTFWLAGAPWYAMMYYDYYLYTQDRDFLQKRALPFMEEAILFYEDFLQEDENGKYYVNPSYSPENQPKNAKTQACINATMDIMAINGLLRSVIETSEILGINKDKIIKWKKMQEKMPAYQLNSNGELKEWMWEDMPDNHQHRHVSHLLGLYDYHDPLIMTNPDIVEGCRRVIKQRMNYRRTPKGRDMAFGLCHLAFSAAALGEKEQCEEMLGWLGDYYWKSNLFSTHNEHNVFNCDISGGYPSVVMKMLVYSEPGVVSLLPATPDSWEEGNISGVALRGGIIMKDLTWGRHGVSATLVAKQSQTVQVMLHNKKIKTIKLKEGKSTVIKL